MLRMPKVPRRATRWARWASASLAVGAFFATLLAASDASAYQWMLRHGYVGCNACHADPSGGGLLEPYGGLLADQLLRTHYSESTEESQAGQFLGGLVPLPEPLRLKGDVRLLSLANKLESRPIDQQWIWMQADLAAGVRWKNFAASASVGYADEGAKLAAITRDDDQNFISRYHWLGFWNDSGSLLVRAGRMNLPFGIRTIEHTLWVRELTQTSINDDQSHGVSAFYANEFMRAELMALAGNFQTRPDEYRERGYSGYAEFILTDGLALGASSLIAHKELDSSSLEQTWRQAHGIMGRWATPWEELLLATEVDYVLVSSQDRDHRKGWVGYLQADMELMQGIHVIATGETNTVGLGDTVASYGAWLSYQWFFAPHADVRLDNVFYRLRTQTTSSDAVALLAQFHVYL